jgi:NMD protein affecting ribosome stability and mRNA decay
MDHPKDISAGYSPVLPEDIDFEARAERAYLEAATHLLEPTVCPQCDAIFMEGRWRWGPVPVSAYQAICPACDRIERHDPAGYLTLGGSYLREHFDNMLAWVNEQAERKRRENPLLRMMDIERGDERVRIATTDVRLAHFLGAAVHHHYQGHLRYFHEAAGERLQVYWTR